jgi:hypothetical protein
VTPKEGTPPLQLEVTANAVFAAIPLSTARAERNVQGSLDSASSYLNRPQAPPGELDLHPKGSWATAVSGDVPAAKAFPDWEQDFDGAPRLPRSIGAYVENAANPGWTLQLDRKPAGAAGKRGP